jgi:hypothetical protein
VYLLSSSAANFLALAAAARELADQAPDDQAEELQEKAVKYALAAVSLADSAADQAGKLQPVKDKGNG